jgi:flagellar FliL protein
MIKLLLPILLVVIGAGAGIGAGIVLRPQPEPSVAGQESATAEKPKEEIDPENLPEYVKLNNQFVVPVLKEEQVAAMVILALSLEVTKGSTADVFAREPKLRDGFLQILFEHANAGGFDGSFTDADNLLLLRMAFLESAQKVLGDKVSDVLINEIARQDSR